MVAEASEIERRRRRKEKEEKRTRYSRFSSVEFASGRASQARFEGSFWANFRKIANVVHSIPRNFDSWSNEGCETSGNSGVSREIINSLSSRAPHAKSASVYRECANISVITRGIIDHSHLKLSLLRKYTRRAGTRSFAGCAKVVTRSREARLTSTRALSRGTEKRIIREKIYTCATGKRDRINKKEKDKTYIHSHKNGQMDAHIDRVTYVAGDEVTEFAMIPLNLRQVHFWYSIFEFRSVVVAVVAGQTRSLGVDTERSARDTETSTFSQLRI